MLPDFDQGCNRYAVVQVGKRPSSGMDNKRILVTKARYRKGNTLAEVGSLREGSSGSQLSQNIQSSCAVNRHIRPTVRRSQLEYFVAVASAKHTNRVPRLLIFVVTLERG